MKKKQVGQSKHKLKIADLPKGDSNNNPADISFWSLVAEDYRTHRSSLATQGFWALFIHRFGNWVMDVRPWILHKLLQLIYKVLFKLCQIICGIELHYSIPVGRKVSLLHFGGMIIGARSIGNGVVISHNTTIGVSRDEGDCPIIEEYVRIGPGAVIAGDITIGHHSRIGPNAVVLKDIPPCSVAFGIPARVMSKNMDHKEACKEYEAEQKQKEKEKHSPH